MLEIQFIALYPALKTQLIDIDIYFSSLCPAPLLLSTSPPAPLPPRLLPEEKENKNKKERKKGTISGNVGYLQVTYSINLFSEKYQVVFLAKNISIGGNDLRFRGDVQRILTVLTVYPYIPLENYSAKLYFL